MSARREIMDQHVDVHTNAMQTCMLSFCASNMCIGTFSAQEIVT